MVRWGREEEKASNKQQGQRSEKEVGAQSEECVQGPCCHRSTVPTVPPSHGSRGSRGSTVRSTRFKPRPGRNYGGISGRELAMKVPRYLGSLLGPQGTNVLTTL